MEKKEIPMRRILPILANATLALALAGPVLAQGKAQTVCPVRGEKIDRNVYTDYQGKRVYLC
jgi:hypothetical protein